MQLENLNCLSFSEQLNLRTADSQNSWFSEQLILKTADYQNSWFSEQLILKTADSQNNFSELRFCTNQQWKIKTRTSHILLKLKQEFSKKDFWQNTLNQFW